MAIQREKWVCFTCRKMFRPYLAEVQGAHSVPPCPQCMQPLRRVGHKFKAPKQINVRQWQKVETLLDNGITFFGAQVRPPKRLSEVKAYLRENPPRKPTG